jgi:hypothetical protein
LFYYPSVFPKILTLKLTQVPLENKNIHPNEICFKF